ncbi:MAG: hypothetical protein SGILL_004624 [Bacillariaceae sp.]
MPPYSSPFSAAATHHNGDLSRSYTRGTSSSSLGFTSNLMETIAVSKSKMNEWARHEKAKADATAESYRQRLMQEQAVIDAKSTELLAVQMERGMKLEAQNDDDASQDTADNIASRKQALEEETSAVQMEIMKLQTEKENRQGRVKTIKMEEKKQRMRANEVRDFKMQVEDDKKTTLDDLTRGVVNYKMLGLDFVRTEQEGRLRFTYNKLDPNDSARAFSFLLGVTEKETYDIIECEPEIEPSEMELVLKELNKEEDMAALARRMRKVFKDMCCM